MQQPSEINPNVISVACCFGFSRKSHAYVPKEQELNTAQSGKRTELYRFTLFN
jgi:hypothetical protein